MNIASMFLRILAIVGAVAAAVMFYMIGDSKDRLEADLRSTSDQLNQSQNRLNTVTGERDELNGQVAELTENLEETKARTVTLDNQLTAVRKELADAKQAISTTEREAETLRIEATRIRRELLEARTEASQLPEGALEADEAAALQANITRLEELLRTTEGQIPTVDGQPASAGGQERRNVLRGQIVEVGDKSAFVVLDIGSTDGVRENSSVMIRRGPRFVGRANIREVHEGTSVLEVLPGSESIRLGDNAITLN